MGFIVGKSMFIEGWFARLMYRSLYKMHQRALHGWTKVVLDTLRPDPDAQDRAACEIALASSRPKAGLAKWKADRREGAARSPRGLPRHLREAKETHLVGRLI